MRDSAKNRGFDILMNVMVGIFLFLFGSSILSIFGKVLAGKADAFFVVAVIACVWITEIIAFSGKMHSLTSRVEKCISTASAPSKISMAVLYFAYSVLTAIPLFYVVPKIVAHEIPNSFIPVVSILSVLVATKFIYFLYLFFEPKSSFWRTTSRFKERFLDSWLTLVAFFYFSFYFFLLHSPLTQTHLTSALGFVAITIFSLIVFLPLRFAAIVDRAMRVAKSKDVVLFVISLLWIGIAASIKILTQ
ncbi:MAG: hypothetical protein ABIA47_01125 [bacterium]